MMNPMQGNPMMQLRQQLYNAVNPMPVVEKFAQQNPILQRYLPLVTGKNQQQVTTTFCNMCRQRGVDPQAFLNQIRQRFPG